MKREIVTIFVSSVLLLAACAQKDEGGGASTNQAQNVDTNRYATTPQPCNNPNQQNPNCYNGQYYGNNPWSQDPNAYQWHNGGWLFPYQVQPVSGCGCPGGYFPVNTPAGLGCAPESYRNFGGGGGLYFYAYVGTSQYPWDYYWGGRPQPAHYWDQPHNRGYFVNNPQQNYSAWNNICTQTTAQGCDVRQNNCPTNFRCVAVAGGSTLGLCVR